MNDSTVVLIDLVGSSGTQFTRIDDVLTMVGSTPSNVRYCNTWGDALIAVFPSAVSGLLFALDLRFRVFTHDWRAVGSRTPPRLRTAVAVGPLDFRPERLTDRDVPEGGALVSAARIEPGTAPGEVRVTRAVKDIAGDQQFDYEFLGECELAKSAGRLPLYCAASKAPDDYLPPRQGGVIRDQQYFLREDAFARFTWLWFVLDQLPGGSWGRSVPHWMENVWNDVPTIAPNPLMEDEGGFETTVLNLELLYSTFGAAAVLRGVGARALGYLEKRRGPKGFGTLGLSRQGTR